MITTRFAPSPTGNIHIGGLRTALYAYAFARQNAGTAFLRIEDTDQKREVEGAAERLEPLLKSFGLSWDFVCVQSQRAKEGIYARCAHQLVSEGKAFYCQCEGRNAKKEGYSVELRDPCRDLGLTSGAIKLRTPDNEIVSYYDFVAKKDISWNTNDVKDATLLKSDGVFPTYHLAVAVDDHEMKVSHIFRGHDWLPSTPIHILVFKYLGYEMPALGHLTDILDPEGGKLSKRKGSTSCEGLLADGYLPEALVNFVALCGWAPKDNREMYTVSEFVDAFMLDGIQKSNPVFNRDKLDWFNREYIKKLSPAQQFDHIRPYINQLDEYTEEMGERIVPIIIERIVKFGDIIPMIEQGELQYFFADPAVSAELITAKGTDITLARQHLGEIATLLRAHTGEWDAESIKSLIMPYADLHGRGAVLWPLRTALSGRDKSPDPFTLIAVLGPVTSMRRIRTTAAGE
jgi:glutamyl-tRNA synthetase